MALFAWVRADLPGCDDMSVFQKTPHSFTVPSAASAKAEMGPQVSAYILGNSGVKLPVAGECGLSHKSEMCLLENAKAVAV